MEIKKVIQCNQCRMLYTEVPLGRYSVDLEGRVYFNCKCGKELVGLLKPKIAGSQPSLAYPSQANL